MATPDPSGTLPLAGVPEDDVTMSAADARKGIRAAQASADAALHAKFEAGGEAGFDYSQSAAASRGITLAHPHPQDGSSGAPTAHVDPASGVSVTAYLARMQRGGLIQSFGCMLLLEESTFSVLAFSENAPLMLGLLDPQQQTKAAEGAPAAAAAGAGAHAEGNGSEPSTSPSAAAAPASPGGGAGVGEHKPKKGLGAAFRSLSVKIQQAISTNLHRGGPKKNPRTKSWRETAAGGEAGSPTVDQSPMPQTAAAAAASPTAAAAAAAAAAAPAAAAMEQERQSTSAPTSPKVSQRRNSLDETADLQRTASGSKWNPFRRPHSPSGSPESSPGRSPTKNSAAAVQVSPTPAPAPAPAKPPPKLELGVSALELFTADSAEGVKKVAGAKDVGMMNPMLVQVVGTEKPFYAIFHRTTDGLHMDLEPICPEDPIFTGEGALQAHRLAQKAIGKLQRVPGGHLKELCEAVVQEVRELTGYDRIMVYRFHEDEHGEVLAEARKETMEPYLGLHYPATDIPQAARFLFMKNRVRIIVDANAENVKVVQDEGRFKEPVALSNSTLRAVHGCHAQYMRNMGTLGSIGMAIVVNDPDAKDGMDRAKKLWGLVVCHHEEPRYLPYPLRLACEFLMQVFGLKMNMEIEMEAQEKEKQMLRVQTLLCDMLQRDAPIGIMTQFPNITDLVKCDGAALLYGGKFWTLGTTPTHKQMNGIVDWLQCEHAASAGFSTDSLKDSGYPGAEALGDLVCGMVAAQLIGRDYLFWFRSPVEKEVVWAGAKHALGDKDDGRKMNPRSSFAAFLEVVRHRSAPWDDLEIDAVSSLVLILRGHLTSFTSSDLRDMETTRLASRDVERLSIAESELSRILETATAPVFTVDRQGNITAWNSKMQQLTGLTVGEALGMSLVHQVAREESMAALGNALSAALSGQEAKNIDVRLKRFAARGGKFASSSSLSSVGSSSAGRLSMSSGSLAAEDEGEVVLVMNAFVSRGGLLEDDTWQEEGEVPVPKKKGEVSGVCFVGQDLTAQKMVEGHFTKVQGDYSAIVHANNSLTPPIFAIDERGHCAEWNPAMETITGIPRDEVLGEVLLGGVFGSLLRMKTDVKTKLMIVLNKAVSGHNTERYPVAFLSRHGQLVEALLTVNARRDAMGAVLGAFCFLHTASPELQAAIKLQRAAEEFAEAKAKAVAYVRQEIKAPLDGCKYVRSRMEAWPDLGEDAKKVLVTSVRCEQLVTRVLGDDNVDNLEEGFLGLENDEYMLEEVVDTVVSMAKQACDSRGVRFECECREDITQKPPLCGDVARLQLALADFACTAAQFTPSGGWLTLKVITGSRTIFVDPKNLRCEFRILHSGEDGLPAPILNQMLDRCEDKGQMTQEGLGLVVSRRIVLAMDGDVQYTHLPHHSEFVIRMVLPYPTDSSSCATPKMTSSPYVSNVAREDASTADIQVDIV